MAKVARKKIVVAVGECKVELPFLILTQNLIIRPLLDQDYDVISQSIRQSLLEMRMWLPWMMQAPSEDDYLILTKSLFEEARSGIHCHFCIYHNETFLGMCSYMDIRNLTGATTIGFWCRADSNAEMFFVDAINAIIRYGFTSCNIRKFRIPCVVGNYLGELAAKKLNFKLAALNFVEDKQIKDFFIDSSLSLPRIAMQVVNEK